MTAGYSTVSSGSCDPGRHGAIYLTRPYTTCYDRFVRWRRAGVWATIMNALAGAHNAAVQMIDTSIVRVHQHGACINRNGRQCMGRSRGGLTSKIHALVDSNGLPVRLALTPGEAHDNRLAGKLLSRMPSKVPVEIWPHLGAALPQAVQTPTIAADGDGMAARIVRRKISGARAHRRRASRQRWSSGVAASSVVTAGRLHPQRPAARGRPMRAYHRWQTRG